jgi:hypothetical protein
MLFVPFGDLDAGDYLACKAGDCATRYPRRPRMQQSSCSKSVSASLEQCRSGGRIPPV